MARLGGDSNATLVVDRDWSARRDHLVIVVLQLI